MTETRITLNVGITQENVGAVRRKIVHIVHFGGTDWRASSRKEAVAECSRALQFCTANRGVIVAYDASGQPWAATAVDYQTWEVRRVAPDAAGCAIMQAKSANDLRVEIQGWNAPT